MWVWEVSRNVNFRKDDRPVTYPARKSGRGNIQFCTVPQFTAGNKKNAVKESLDDIFKNIVGVLPDTGKTLEEYKEERMREKYETAN